MLRRESFDASTLKILTTQEGAADMGMPHVLTAELQNCCTDPIQLHHHRLPEVFTRALGWRGVGAVGNDQDAD